MAVAIRDAQELGMHTDSLDPKPKDTSMESMRENDWLIQRRRGMYMTLATWYDPPLFFAEKGLLPLANLCAGISTWP